MLAAIDNGIAIVATRQDIAATVPTPSLSKINRPSGEI